MKVEASVNVGKLRMYVFVMWIGYWVVALLTLFAAPFIRNSISTLDISDAVMTISGIWVPILGCFAGFWFLAPAERQRNVVSQVPLQNAQAAIIISIVHLSLILLFLIFQVFAVDTSGPEFGASEIPAGVPVFLDRIVACVRWATLTSPFGTAPVLFLTGRDVLQIKASELSEKVAQSD